MKREDFPTDERGTVLSIETDDAIYGFFGRYRFLSNFHPCSVTLEGITYQCSEGAYMAQKTEDLAIRAQLSKLSGTAAKKLGRSIQLRSDWDAIRVHAMYRALLAKFTQNESCCDGLLDTGNKYLEETNWWGDTFWGCCDGVGANNLGRTLMTIREFLRSIG